MAVLQISGVPTAPAQQVTKTLTFTGLAGAGAAGSMTALTVSGKVLLRSLVFTCSADLTTSGAATIACGVSGATAAIIAATVATTIDANLIWLSATPTAGLLALVALATNIVIASNIIFTIAVADITGGSLVVTATYEPLTVGASLT